MHDELIQKLNASFILAASQINDSSGRGYRIRLHAPWRDNGLGVKYYHVQLCGIDPLTGEDVQADNIYAQFNFAANKAETPLLTYHGTFRLCCTAYLSDGREIPFKEQAINLNFPQNCPYVKYTVSGTGGFRHVKLESNCWANCADKIWLRFDGHEQHVHLPVRFDKTVRFYVPTSGNVEVRVQDDLIQVRNGW